MDSSSLLSSSAEESSFVVGSVLQLLILIGRLLFLPISFEFFVSQDLLFYFFYNDLVLIPLSCFLALYISFFFALRVCTDYLIFYYNCTVLLNFYSGDNLKIFSLALFYYLNFLRFLEVLSSELLTGFDLYLRFFLVYTISLPFLYITTVTSSEEDSYSSFTTYFAARLPLQPVFLDF